MCEVASLCHRTAEDSAQLRVSDLWPCRKKLLMVGEGFLSVETHAPKSKPLPRIPNQSAIILS
jgi:hypothetical protein